MAYKNGDFKMYYDSTQNRNIWVLGYFGGGSINFKDFEEVATDYAKVVGVPIETVQIDEVLSSRRFKHFKFVYSQAEGQSSLIGSDVMDNVYQWLRD